MLTKNLQVGDKIIFILNNTMEDAEIIEKEQLDKGDISFTLKLEGDKKMRIKHRDLNIYYKF